MKDTFQFEINFCRSILKRDPENIATLEMLAGYCTRAGQIDEGLALDRKIVHLDPENAIGHYNVACSLAIKNRKREAIDRLRTAMEKGYRDFDWLMEDPDLTNIHDEPEFSALVSEYKTHS
jgi:predicted Zn-dependent protease